MQRDPRAWLWDAREAADAILAFTAGLGQEAYGASELVHSAVERKFEIIGEALNQLSKVEPTLAARITDIAQIIAFRNVLIHGYVLIEHDRVWSVITSSLPKVREELDLLLKQLGAPGQP